MQPQPVIVTAMGVAVLNNTVANLRSTNQRTPTPRLVIAGFALTIGLLILAEFAATVAAALAIFILVASLAGPNGTELANLIIRNVSK